MTAHKPLDVVLKDTVLMKLVAKEIRILEIIVTKMKSAAAESVLRINALQATYSSSKSGLSS